MLNYFFGGPHKQDCSIGVPLFRETTVSKLRARRQVPLSKGDVIPQYWFRV